MVQWRRYSSQPWFSDISHPIVSFGTRDYFKSLFISKDKMPARNLSNFVRNFINPTVAHKPMGNEVEGESYCPNNLFRALIWNKTLNREIEQ